jgi:hypothetical protein
MALVHADFVEETTTTTGGGTLSLAGATTGNRTFVAGIGSTNTCIYGIAASDGTFESGIGTVTDASPDTLARTTLLTSSTGSKLDLPAGTHRVYCTWAAEGGTKAYAACPTDDTRLSDARTPTAHGSDKHNALDVVLFDTTPTVGGHTEGQVFWDTTWKTATLEMQDDINLQLGQETVAYVYNGTGSAIANGAVVYTSGTQAGVPSVSLAQGDADATSQVLGMVTSYPSIANGAYGFVTIRGHVNGINTDAWTLGDNLYLDAAVAGALTNVKPNTGDYDTRIGRAMLKHASTGRVYVNMVREYRVGVVSAGAGVEMFPDDTTIIASGTQSTYPIKTLSKTPVTSAEDVDTIAVTAATSPVLYGAYLNTAPIGQTSIAGGVWDFEIWAGVSSATNVTSITQNVNRVRAEAGTVTTTGTAGTTTRTATASIGTPFAEAKIDVGGTAATDSFLQTTTGLFRIASRVSDTEITITVPSTYDNQSTVAFSVHKRLFGVSTGEMNNVATATAYAGLQKYSVQSVQAAFTVEATDTLSSTFLGVSDGTRSVYFSHNGTTRYSHFSTPLVALHKDLAGLQGGAAGEYYHLTAAQVAPATAVASTTSLGLAPQATAPAAGLLSVLAIANGATVRSDTALFDTANPAALGTAAPGTSIIASRKDHVHAAPTQCITFTKTGTLATGTGVARYYFNDSRTLTKVRIGVGTAPTGTNLIVDVNKNGTTIFTTQSNRPEIAASGFTDESGTVEVTSMAANDYLSVDIDQIGSTIAGADLVVNIYYT